MCLEKDEKRKKKMLIDSPYHKILDVHLKFLSTIGIRIKQNFNLF